MEGVKSPTLQSLRLKYNAALAAHQGCARALLEASMGGARPSSAMLETEARARAELERARAELLAAMTESITGHAPEAHGPASPPVPSPTRAPDAS